MSFETTPKLWQVIMAAVERGTQGIRTTLPGVFLEYNPDTNRATVQATVPDAFWGEDQSRITEPIAPFTDVPVAQIGSGKVRIKFPIKKGDECELHFCSSALTGWKANGTRIVDPQDDRRHHDADVVAWPVCLIKPEDAVATIEFTEDNLVKIGGTEPLVKRSEFLNHTHATAGTGTPSPPVLLPPGPSGSPVTFPGTEKLRG